MVDYLVTQVEDWGLRKGMCHVSDLRFESNKADKAITPTLAF